MSKEGWLERDRTAVGVSGGAGADAVLIPGALAVGGALGFGVTYESEQERAGLREHGLRIEFGKLEEALPGDSNPTLYLIALYQAIGQARLHVDREVWRQVLDNLLAESELELRPIDKSGTSEEPAS